MIAIYRVDCGSIFALEVSVTLSGPREQGILIYKLVTFRLYTVLPLKSIWKLQLVQNKNIWGLCKYSSQLNYYCLAVNSILLSKQITGIVCPKVDINQASTLWSFFCLLTKPSDFFLSFAKADAQLRVVQVKVVISCHFSTDKSILEAA